jgi:hypothetical protein
MLGNAHVATRLPVRDLDRARRFYAEKVGLEPAEERPGGLLYQLASGEFALYRCCWRSKFTSVIACLTLQIDCHWLTLEESLLHLT